MIEIGKWNDLKVIRSKDFGIYLGEEDSSTAETVPPEKTGAGGCESRCIPARLYLP